MTERNWETSARGRLEGLVADTVDRLRSAANEIEREAKHNVISAAKDVRSLEFQTYQRVPGQVIHSVQTVLFNLKLDSLIDAAADAEAARTERLRDMVPPKGSELAAVKRDALAKLLEVLDGWIDGARSNHDGLGHSGEPVGDQCWHRFHPSDIRNMVNDAAREVGLAEFPLPEKPEEDKVR